MLQVRYKIAFLATDPEVDSDAEEKTIEIICFGAVADGMIGLPADSLMSLASNVQGYIPEQIKRLYGGKYDFNLSVPRGAVRRGRTSFRVDSLTRIIEVEKHALPEAETCMFFMVFTLGCMFAKFKNPATIEPMLCPQQLSCHPTLKEASSQVPLSTMLKLIHLMQTPVHLLRYGALSILCRCSPYL